MSLGYTFEGENSIRMRLNRVCDAIDKLYQDQLGQLALIRELEQQGTTDASIHWRRRPEDGRPGILELLHSQDSDFALKNGRRREYIGTDPEKQAEAFARRKRWKALQEAKATERGIRDQLSQLEARITALELLASTKQLNFGDRGPRGSLAGSPQERR